MPQGNLHRHVTDNTVRLDFRPGSLNRTRCSRETAVRRFQRARVTITPWYYTPRAIILRCSRNKNTGKRLMSPPATHKIEVRVGVIKPSDAPRNNILHSDFIGNALGYKYRNVVQTHRLAVNGDDNNKITTTSPQRFDVS